MLTTTTRRAIVVVCLLGSLAACSAETGPPSAVGSSSSSTTSDPSVSTPSTPSRSPSATPTPEPVELPRGGRRIFPRYRLVGYSGNPGSAAFGRLGEGDLDDRVDEIEARARLYTDGREPLPVLELIAVVAHDTPGRDDAYSSRVSDAVIKRYLAAARRHHALLLLGVQPGRRKLLPVVRELERWLVEPDVGVALDPEWEVAAPHVPGEVFGRTTGRELDGVAAYLAGLVDAHDLPQKAMIFHQVAAKVVHGEGGIRERDEVAVVKSVDGIGSRSLKTSTWRVLVKDLPDSVHAGFKLFFTEDRRHGPLMTPKQVLALRPQPEYVLYE